MDGSEEYGAERGCGDAWFYKRSSAGKARETPGIDFCFKQQYIWPTARAKRPSKCAVCGGLHRVSDGQFFDNFHSAAYELSERGDPSKIVRWIRQRCWTSTPRKIESKQTDLHFLLTLTTRVSRYRSYKKCQCQKARIPLEDR